MVKDIGKEYRYGPITASISDDSGWFRLFGRGFYWKNTDTAWISFSERNGYKKTIKINKYLIGYLPKN
jgi:hypothetical protein